MHKNLLDDGMIRDFNLPNKSDYKFTKETIKVINSFFNVQITDQQVFEDKYVFSRLTDTSETEPKNKRVQGAWLKEIARNDLTFIGLYPIVNNNDEIVDVMCGVWGKGTFSDIVNTKSNPGLKLGIEELQLAYNTNKIVNKKTKKKYQSTVVPYKLLFEYLEFSDIVLDVKKEDFTPEEVSSVVNIRVRNSKLHRRFKNSLHENYGGCMLCGLKKKELLVASHIYPVKDIMNNDNFDDNKKAFMISDLSNGLLLCVNHDALFDKGFISFDNKGKIKISDKVRDIKGLVNIDNSNIININEINKDWLKYHRTRIYRR